MSKIFIAVKIETLLENGRKEIKTKKRLEKYPIGSLISYMNIDNVFRPGGFIIDFNDEYFVYISPDFTTKHRGRYSHITKMWVGTVYTTRNDIVSIVPTLKKKTNFPVIVNGIVIYYAKKTFDAKRFKNTDKYKRIIKWCEYFEPRPDESSLSGNI